MKAFRLMIFAVVVALILALPAFSQKVDIFGYYTIEKAPKAFANISEIHLAGNYGAEQKPPVYGLIRFKKSGPKDNRLLKPRLVGKNLSFKTNSRNGLRYEFSGMFTRLENFPETKPEGQVILKGRLTKYRGKRKVASAYLRFSYTAGD